MSEYNRKREFRPRSVFINGIKLLDRAGEAIHKKRQLARNRLEDMQMYKDAGLNPKDFKEEFATVCKSRVSKTEEM